MFDWLLHTLNDIIGSVLRTIFTDEDSAIVPAMAHFCCATRADVAHHVCVFHKQMNFTKHVNSARATAATRSEAVDLFHEICYAKEEGQVSAAIDKIRHLLPSMSDYLDREITEKLALFSEAFRGDAFTLGFSATSVAESANSMIKRYLPPRVSTLVDIRKACTRSYVVKALGKQAVVQREFRRPHFLWEIYHSQISRTVCSLIDEQVEQSKGWQIHSPHDGSDEFEAICGNGRRWGIKVDERGPICECNETSKTGLPCPHLLALYSQCADHAFPTALIAPRWIPDVNKTEIPALPMLSIEEHDDLQRISVRSTDEEEILPVSDLLDGPNDGPSLNDDPETEAVAQGNTSNGRYARLLYLGKQIAQKGSISPARYEGVIQSLRMVLESLTEPVDGEIRDVDGRHRGRPRGAGHSQSHREGSACPLCGQMHPIHDCPSYAVFQEEKHRYHGTIEGRMHCTLCGYGGHNKLHVQS
jgi:hypothetical protein